MLSLKAQIIATGLSVIFLIMVVELIRRHRLQARYAWLWLVLSLAMLVGSFIRGGIDSLAHLIGVYQPAVGLLAIVVFGILLLVLHLTVTVSRLSEQNTRLAQDLALLRADIQSSQPPPTTSPPPTTPPPAGQS